ncbi:MAG: sugar ABC transporter permease [Anaerolineae bacterium]|nr:sugar ABC transporter permease [Anaerolineae bacterium]
MTTRPQPRFNLNYLYILPMLSLVVAFIYYGIIYTADVSLYDWNGISLNRKFIGLDNYQAILRDPVFFQALKNTFLFMFVTILTQMVLGLTIAVLLRSQVRLKSIYKIIFFVPVVLASAVVSYIFRQILNANGGELNAALTAMGLESLAHPWLADPATALLALAAINIWQWTGFSFMMYFAALTVIDEHLYEAARIDGANFWQRVFYVTIPLLRPTHFSLIILGMIGTLKTFDIVYLTTNGGPGRSTEMLSTYIFKRGILEFDAGYSAALSIILLLIALVLTVVQLRAYSDQ